MQPYDNIMLDFETMSLDAPRAAVVEIGVVPFKWGHSSGNDISLREHHFDMRVWPGSYQDGQGLDGGYHVCPATIQWWDNQDEAIRKSVFSGMTHWMQVLKAFEFWLNAKVTTGVIVPLPQLRVWARDPDFDCAILKYGMEREGFGWPFSYNKMRSVRTICDLAPVEVLETVPPNMIKHSAICDALHQTKQVIACQAWINRGYKGE